MPAGTSLRNSAVVLFELAGLNLIEPVGKGGVEQQKPERGERASHSLCLAPSDYRSRVNRLAPTEAMQRIACFCKSLHACCNSGAIERMGPIR
jgi:hypothetical protein